MGRYKQLGGSKSPCMKNLPDCSADTLHGKKKKKNNPQGNPQSKWALGAFNLILKKWIMELCWQCWEGCFQRWLRWLLLESPAMSRTSTTGNGRFPECWWKETEREREVDSTQKFPTESSSLSVFSPDPYLIEKLSLLQLLGVRTGAWDS